MQNEDFERLTQLWALRALHWKGTLYRFVKDDGFHDDDIARELGLNNWLNECDSVERVRRKLLLSDVPERLRNKLLNQLDSKTGGNKHDERKFERTAVLAVLRNMRRVAEEQASQEDPIGPPYFEKNCVLLKETYGLNDVEIKILRLKVLEYQGGLISDAVCMCGTKNRWAHVELLAAMLDESPASINEALTYDSRLLRLKLIETSKSRSTFTFIICEEELSRRICYGACTLEDIFREIACLAPEPTLNYNHYPHLTETLKPLRNYLRTVLRMGTPGINIFIHGSPGTGKSELSRALAREMRTQLYEISSEDGAGMPIRPERRLDALVKAGEIMKQRRTILVFDEAEDIFRSSSFLGRSLASERKGWTNRLLENNPVPLIWIANSLGDLDPAFARRFDFIFEVKTPPRSQRKVIYKKICGRSIPEATIRKAVECEALTPAILQRAKSVTDKIYKIDKQVDYLRVFEDRLKQTLEAQGHDTKTFTDGIGKIPIIYDLSYLNCSKPLNNIGEALRDQSDCRICLYGPPGTGKTTLGHWLAHFTNRPLHVKKASDLLGSFLGQTERALARAFEDAEDDNAILLIDEVDGFLQDRRDAQRSWEVQQVNELLTQMERFKGTFIASTNLMDGIDPAALRRFDLKLRFDYLKPMQSRELLLQYSKELNLTGSIELAEQLLESLSNCTPGDFANVARQHRFQPFRGSHEFAEAIAHECQLKTARAGGRKLGFG